MRESKASKPSDAPNGGGPLPPRALPFPAPGLPSLPLIVIALLSLLAGLLRREPALILMGAALLVAFAWTFLTVFVLVLAHRKRAASLKARVSPEAAPAGGEGAALCLRENLRRPASASGANRGKFFRLPGILIRYEISLSTADGKKLYHVFDPDALKDSQSHFVIPERGAYYGPRDKLLIFDILGFFTAAFILPAEPGARLLSLPRPAGETPGIELHAAGGEQRSQPRFARTDNLIDQRPYVPGDDPRRINWKLYGHIGDLFVREGGPEPPPCSKLTLLIDTQVDAGLFTPEAGRRAVDLLCENALALVIEYNARAVEIVVGYTGGKAPQTGSLPELAVVLAHPAALPLNAPPGGHIPELPAVPNDRAALILALPRQEASDSALDRFLKERGNGRVTDILFLYEGDSPDDAAEVCARFYSRKPGTRARRIRLVG